MPSILDQYARKIITEHHKKIGPVLLPPSPGIPITQPPSIGHPVSHTDQAVLPFPYSKRIGIIGAGGAGLFAAMELERYMEEHDISLSYEILEAEPLTDESHIGGRLWTHKFSELANDYYDRGAMRFPKIDMMEPVFRLFDRLDITQQNGTLIDYVQSQEHNMRFYNSTAMTVQELTESTNQDPFDLGLLAPASEYIEGALGPLKKPFEISFDEGWKNLVQFDDYTTRDYMKFFVRTHKTSGGTLLVYTDQVITTLEMLESGTGLYDCALVETVMSSLQFDHHCPWYGVQGGAGEIARRMAATLKGPILRGKRVTAIVPFGWDFKHLLVTVAGEPVPRIYSHVISTIPLSSLSFVDLRECRLSYEVQTAIRALRYNASVKVGIQFSKRWWEEAPFLQRGGVSSTDRPTRRVVYPSYGIGRSDTGATMIVSYNLGQDALRFGALARGHDSPDEAILLDIILRDLADIHGHDLDADYLRSLMVNYDVWAWYNHSNSAGAFAHFGPGQFSNIYCELTKPPAGRLHFAGEAVSTKHGWLAGALDSASRCVREVLLKEDEKPDKEPWRVFFEYDDTAMLKQIALGQARFGI